MVLNENMTFAEDRTLAEELDIIKRGKNPVTVPEEGEAYTIRDLWENFVEERLPNPGMARKWHEFLKEYVELSDAVFAIRPSFTGETKRGFLTKTVAGYAFHYADNIQAKYYCKMCMDCYIPDSIRELLNGYRSFLMPAREGTNPSEKGEEAAFPYGRADSFRGLHFG